MEHNNSKRRRQNKIALRVLRNPKKREQLLTELARMRTPLRKMQHA